nr:hypothetical protein [Tanacetum cinerariifolium]
MVVVEIEMDLYPWDFEAVAGESSDPRKPTVIRYRIKSQPYLKTPIPTTTKIDIDNFDEATRLSIATKRILEDLEAQQNVERVQEHLVKEDIEDIVEGELRSYKGSPKVKKRVDVLIIHDDDEEEELDEDALKQRKRENGKGIEEIMVTPLPTPIRSLRTYISSLSLDK